ncbi:NRPS-like protein biosynthetic cluster [Penicillium longicatenatum]|uniref:NRPS-like protein biosynthetic cluster n=1 Tax=Penicillium longicatenatum TaxID=1561947 RepID=UPI002546E572|nr:NRPS-like protein biosynthetic cluster [Penicillium longicatenatum]KAJ5636333.1 NRPS-like protein biosynthetic cluster [Penicillium longicatenatum]
MLQTVQKACPSGFLTIIAGNTELCLPIDKFDIWILVDGQMDGWISFENLMQEKAQAEKTDILEPLESSILFTSGTNSLPKGCFIQTSSFPFTSALGWSQGSQPILPGDKFAHVLPNNHSYSYTCLMSYFMNGATVVFPGPTFVPRTLLQAIQKEQCSHVALVPTMVLALSIAFTEKKVDSLRRVVLAGAPPNEEILRICLEQLGACGVQNVYGMTEGIFAQTDTVSHASDILAGKDISIGMPFPSIKMKICFEGRCVPLPVGTAGEMHFSGPTLIKEYKGKSDDELFYSGADGRKWFRTGDKAIMGKDNRLYLIGRYKDIIIRGGENIDPSAIEAVLGQIPEFCALEPQVVRYPHPIAGEVTIVVVKSEVNKETARQIKDMIRAEMGAMSVPAEVVSVQSLGSHAYPRNITGKVQKSNLEGMVKSCWQKRQSTAHSNLNLTTPLNSTDCQNIVTPSIGSRVNEALLSAMRAEKNIEINPAIPMIDLGVDSISCIAILHRVYKETRTSLPSSLFSTQATVGTASEWLCLMSYSTDPLKFNTLNEDPSHELCSSHLLQGIPKPGIPSLFLTPPGSGYAFVYKPLPKFANSLAVYVLTSPYLMTSKVSWTVEDAAAIYLKTIQNLQAQGPYILGG